jgi:hypothetical protein
LDIGFSTKALRNLSESETLACRKLGAVVANAFHVQLADLSAARNVEELPLGFMVSEAAPTRFSLPLAEGFVAVFESNHVRDREAKIGTVTTWRRVNRVKLLEVAKTNG